MSVKYGVLGLLCQRPGYPYEISVRFAHRVGPQWGLNRGQIYQSVEQLEREGLIERVRRRPSPRGAGWVYRATDRGECEFERWFDRGVGAARPLRSELCLRLALSRPEQRRHLVELTRQQELACSQRLAEHAEQRRRAATSNHQALWQLETSELVLEASIKLLSAEIAWLREARAKLELLAPGGRRDCTAAAARAGSLRALSGAGLARQPLLTLG